MLRTLLTATQAASAASSAALIGASGSSGTPATYDGCPMNDKCTAMVVLGRPEVPRDRRGAAAWTPVAIHSSSYF